MALKRSALLASLCLCAPIFTAPTWTGTMSSDWTNSANWSSPSSVPMAGDSPIFPDAATTYSVDYSLIGGLSPIFPSINITTNTMPYTFTGGASTLLFDNPGTLVNSGVVGGTNIGGNLRINGTLNIAQNSPQTIISANISEMLVSSINITGSGVLNLVGSNSYTGSTTVNSGVTLAISADINVGVGGGAIVNLNSGTLQIDASIAFTHPINITGSSIISTDNVVNHNQSINGSGTLIKVGTGILRLSSGNGYGGGTHVNDGTLSINSDTCLGVSSSSLEINNGATLQANGASFITVRSITLAGGGTFDSNGNVLDIGGQVSGTGPLTKIGAGTLNLLVTNTYTGGTVVNVGTLGLKSDQNLGALGSTLNLNAGTTLKANASHGLGSHPIVLTGSTTFDSDVYNWDILSGISGAGSLTKIGTGTLEFGGSTNSYTGGTTVSAGTLRGTTTGLQGAIVNNAAVVFAQSSNGIYAGDLSGTGTLTKENTGTVILSGTNSYSGGTTINGGTLSIDSDARLGALVGGITFDGGTLAFTASTNSARTVTLNAGGGTIDTGATNDALSGTITGSGSLTKTGTGILDITGGTKNYTGGTTISAGTLIVDAANLPGNVIDNGILTFNQGVNGIYLGDISGSGSLNKLGGGILILTGTNTYIGGTTITNGALQGNTTSIQGNIVDNAALIFDQASTGTYSGNISGSGSVAKINAGTLILNGTNTYIGGTTVSAGILQGSTASLQGAIDDNAAVVFDQNFVGTFSGVISGTGSLTKIGTETLSLPNSNAGYSGTVLLNNGTLSIGNGSSLGTGSLTFQVNNGNTLQATGSFAITNPVTFTTNGIIDTQANTFGINGAITGAGSLTKIGTGTLSLPTANGGYNGLTFLENGTLSIGNGSSLGTGSLTFQVNNGNTLQATGSFAISNPLLLNTDANIDSNGNSLILGGAVTGAGSLTKIGAGTVSLSSLGNNYGGTFINNGILQVTGSIVGPVTVNAGTFDVENSFTITDWTGAAGSFAILGVGDTLTFGTSNSTTVASAISGGGGVVKQGSGTVTFTGASTYTGPTQINAGTFVINGSITSPTTVAAGATLKGTGTIASSLIVNGTVRPGNSVGTLNVAGPVTFNSGSTYVEELNPTQASLLNVFAGSVTINPGVTLSILPNPGTYTQGSIYTIIQTTTGVSGTFSTVANSFPLLTFGVLYNPLNVQLVLDKITPFASLVTGNAKAIGACLDNANPPAGSEFSDVLNQLRFVTSTETLQHDLNQLQPSQFNAFQLTQENVNTRIFSVLDTRMGQIHRSCKPSEQTWSVWADGFGDFQQQEHQHGEHGYHATTGAALFGFDGHASSNLHLGLGGAYTATHLKWGGAHGTGDISSGYGFAYGTWHVKHVFLDAEFVGGYNNYDAKRHIGFLATDRNAKSEHHGYTLAGRLLGGFPFKAWKMEVAPLIAIDYDFVHQTSFKEHGAQSLNLHVNEKNANLLRAEAGFRVTRRCPLELKVDPCTGNEFCGSDIRFLPSFQLTLIREWRFQGQKTKSRLQGADCTFTVKGFNPDRTLISPAVGLTWLLYNDRIGITLDYIGEFAFGGKYYDHQGNLQMSYAF